MADTPPKSRVGGSTQSGGRPRPSSMTTNRIADEIAQQVTLAGMAVGAVDPVGGFVLITNAEPFGQAWADVAAVNPRVKLILENWFSKSVYANAGMATGAMLLPLLTHYNLLPRGWYNPAAGAVESIEKMMNPDDGSQPMSLADMLEMHAEAQRRAQAFADTMAAAQNGHVPDDAEIVPDHYEVPSE